MQKKKNDIVVLGCYIRLVVSSGLVYTMLESWNRLWNNKHSIYKALQTIKHTTKMLPYSGYCRSWYISLISSCARPAASLMAV